ncbi:hypothetical protein FKX85_06690 [Echinicola soli]|uniref:Uncharacterized protein n=1 Tax=Echinicola soli TaxID=2591634 RepID=A0A514CFZ9_9BACT|nr:hypothetical protein [Echinicola soli]QDH78739.1 hypothetical protein FKX85_06690 [Echinicola soli]
MKEQDVYQKLKEALEAVESYEKDLKEKKSGVWKNDIDEKLKKLNEKRHVLAASGEVCSCCGGSGRS